MKSRFIVLAALLSILLSACALSLAEDITPPPDYQSPTPGPTMSPLFPQSPPDSASGAAIYAEKCAPCHGEAGLGDGPMASKLPKAPAAIGKPETGRAAAPANWYTVVTEGNINSMMPPFKDGLSDQQRWDVVAYALTLGGSTSSEIQKGQSVYQAQCLQCHGPDGTGSTTPPVASLADQALMAKLTQNDIANFVNKGVGAMPGLGGLLADADIYAVAAYVRSFTMSAGQVASVAPTATTLPATATTLPATATVAPSVAPQTTSSGTLDVTSTPGGTPLAQVTSTPAATSTTAVAATPAVSSTPTPVLGTIHGKVTNASSGTIPGTLKVVLHVFEHDTTTQQFSEVATQEAPLATDGVYSFEKIPLLANRAFYVSVNYLGADYQSTPAFPKAGETSFDLPVSIFETTTDASGLAADQVHILLDYSKTGLVQVVEFYIITNPGKLSVVSSEKGGPVVSVVLPKGYTNLQFEQGAIGDRYLTTTDGFADTTAVTPGMQQYQIVFAIEMPLPKPGLFGGQKLDFAQILPVKANAVSVLVPKGVTIEGTNVTAGTPQDMGNGVTYQVFNAGAFEPGQTLSVTASGIPSSAGQTTTGTNTTQNIIIGIGAFGLVLIVAGGWLFWRERQRATSEDTDEEDDEDDENNESASTQDEIIDAIVALDDQLKSGNISEQAYKERRAELKAKLKSKL
jgi:mono/diheme cytochrome c family protein